MWLNSARWSHCGPTVPSAHSWAVRHRPSCIRVFTVFVCLPVHDMIQGSVHLLPYICLEARPWNSGLSCGFPSVKRKQCSFCALCVCFNSSCLFSLHFSFTSSVPPSVGHCSAHPPSSLSPLFSPTTPPTTPLPSTYCIIPSSSSSSFILFPCATRRGLPLPGAHKFTTTWQTACRTESRTTAALRHALQAVLKRL